jgi:hypothetical protein
MSSETGKLFPFHNVGLFSDHFLSKRLAADSPFWISEKAAAQVAFDKILAQYKEFTSTYKYPPNEAQTENDFIRPILSVLSYSYIVQTLEFRGHNINLFESNGGNWANNQIGSSPLLALKTYYGSTKGGEKGTF